MGTREPRKTSEEAGKKKQTKPKPSDTTPAADENESEPGLKQPGETVDDDVEPHTTRLTAGLRQGR